MGFELCAFLGRYSDLRTWESRLDSATACKLDGELGLVPVTGRLFTELRARLGEKKAARLDSRQVRPSWPFPSFEAAMRRWGAEASKGTVTAYVSMGEFGSQSHEMATLWADGRKVLSDVPLAPVLDYLRQKAGIETTTKPSDLEWHRGERAAEKWEAAARLQRRQEE